MKVFNVYPYPVEPRDYADYYEKPIQSTTHEDLDNKVQFTLMRTFSQDDDGRLLDFEKDIELYENELKLGNAVWFHSKHLFAKNIRDLIDEISKRKLFLFDTWEYWPGVHGDSFEWGTATEYICPLETYDYIKEKSGRRFLGFSLGELDGNYIMTYVGSSHSSSFDKKKQYILFHEHFTEMWDDLYHDVSILLGTNWCHYFAKEGNAKIIGPETAQGFMNVNLWYAFLRGASRQYGTLLFGCVSAYNRWGHKNYLESGTYDSTQWSKYGPEHGTSLSLMRRLFYLLYMYGNDVLGFELGHIYKEGENKNTLTPVGELQRDVIEFSERIKSPGVMYTPVAVLMDFHNGWLPPKSFWHWGLYKTWGCIPYTEADHYTHAIFNLLYPGYEDSSYYRDERGFLTQTPYGDMTDVLFSDVRQEVLDTYSLIIIAGEIKLDVELFYKLKGFVENGGHLIITERQITYGFERIGEYISDYAEFFEFDECCPVFENTYKNGKINIITSGYDMKKNDAIYTNIDVADNEEKSLVHPYSFSQDVKNYIAGCLEKQKIIDIDNKNLGFSVNLYEDGSLLLCVVNNTSDKESFTVLSKTGIIKTIIEQEIPQADFNITGYYANNVKPEDNGKPHENAFGIAPFDIKFYKIILQNENINLKPKIKTIDKRENIFASLNDVLSLKNYILSNPTFIYNFKGIKADASYFIEKDKNTLSKEAQYLKRQNIDIIVDFSALLNHFPDFSLFDIKTKKHNPECSRYKKTINEIGSVFSKAALYDCKKIIIRTHLNAPGLSGDEAVLMFENAIKKKCAMAEEHGMMVYIQNTAEHLLIGSIKKVEEFISGLKISNLKFAYNICHGVNDSENPDKPEALLISSPYEDEYGQRYACNGTVFNSSFKDKILNEYHQFAKKDTHDFICLDGDYKNYNEIYLDRILLDER